MWGVVEEGISATSDFKVFVRHKTNPPHYPPLFTTLKVAKPPLYQAYKASESVPKELVLMHSRLHRVAGDRSTPRRDL